MCCVSSGAFCYSCSSATSKLLVSAVDHISNSAFTRRLQLPLAFSIRASEGIDPKRELHASAWADKKMCRLPDQLRAAPLGEVCSTSLFPKNSPFGIFIRNA